MFFCFNSSSPWEHLDSNHFSFLLEAGGFIAKWDGEVQGAQIKVIQPFGILSLEYQYIWKIKGI